MGRRLMSQEHTMKKVLIVEDDLHIRDIFQMIFETYGYQVECLENGKVLCERDNNWPDVIILDKQLPGLDGVQACQYLKSQPDTKNIPVLLITATLGIDRAAKAAGADDFLEKPFDMKSMINKVSRLIENNNRPGL
jgi:CheY-like chemotaxis protein